MHCPSGSQTGCTPQPCSSSQPFVCTLTHEENHVWQTSKAAQQSDKQPSQPGQEACPVGTRSPWMQQLPCSRLALAQFLASPSLFPTTGGSVYHCFRTGARRSGQTISELLLRLELNVHFVVLHGSERVFRSCSNRSKTRKQGRSPERPAAH